MLLPLIAKLFKHGRSKVLISLLFQLYSQWEWGRNTIIVHSCGVPTLLVLELPLSYTSFYNHPVSSCFERELLTRGTQTHQSQDNDFATREVWPSPEHVNVQSNSFIVDRRVVHMRVCSGIFTVAACLSQAAVLGRSKKFAPKVCITVVFIPTKLWRATTLLWLQDAVGFCNVVLILRNIMLTLLNPRVGGLDPRGTPWWAISQERAIVKTEATKLGQSYSSFLYRHCEFEHKRYII